MVVRPRTGAAARHHPHSVATTFTSSRWCSLDALPFPPLVLSRGGMPGWQRCLPGTILTV